MTSEPRHTNDGHLLTGSRLYWLLVLFAVIGLTLPLMPRFMHEAATGHPTWNALMEEHSTVASFLEEHPIFDISRLFPAIEKLPWSAPRERASLHYYKQFVFWTSGYLALILLFRRRLRAWLRASVDWLHTDDNPRGRRIVFGCISLLTFCFLTRTPMGFWIPQGIGGWTYERLSSKLRDEMPAVQRAQPMPSAEELAFLAKGIRPEKAGYLPHGGFMTGIGMFLHFTGGEVLPGTYGLVEFPKAQYVFTTRYGEIKRPDVFGAIVRDTLSYRRRGKRFLLPLSIGYPNHTCYKLPDYGSYPPPEELERVSFWDITIEITDDRAVRVVTGAKRYEFDV